MNFSKEENKKLIEQYPFLLPHNRWTDEVPKDYDYSYTELIDFPDGWFKAFGKEMLEELKEELIKHDYLYDFRIMQIKEKYGGLRFYTGLVPKDSKIFEIISDYEGKSYHHCMYCGQPAETDYSNYWIETICDSCKKKRMEKMFE